MPVNEQIKSAVARVSAALTQRPVLGRSTGISVARIKDGLTCEIKEGEWTLVADMPRAPHAVTIRVLDADGREVSFGEKARPQGALPISLKSQSPNCDVRCRDLQSPLDVDSGRSTRRGRILSARLSLLGDKSLG